MCLHDELVDLKKSCVRHTRENKRNYYRSWCGVSDLYSLSGEKDVMSQKKGSHNYLCISFVLLPPLNESPVLTLIGIVRSFDPLNDNFITLLPGPAQPTTGFPFYYYSHFHNYTREDNVALAWQHCMEAGFLGLSWERPLITLNAKICTNLPAINLWTFVSTPASLPAPFLGPFKCPPSLARGKIWMRC